MSRFLQSFGQPGALSLYTIFAGHVIAVKKRCEKEEKKKNIYIYVWLFLYSNYYIYMYIYIVCSRVFR